MKRVRRIARQKMRAFERRTRSLRALLSPLRALLIFEAAVLCSALFYALTGGRAALFDNLGNHADIWAIISALAVLGLLHVLVNGRAAAALERRFASESYDERRILFDLGQAARAVTSIEQLFQLVVKQIEEALHTTNISIFVRDDESGDYVCRIFSAEHLAGDAHGSEIAHGQTKQLGLACDSFIVKRLRNLSAPLGVDPLEFESWKRALVSASPKIREARQREVLTLERLRSRLLLQIMMRNELIGIISLGPRISGRPFSADDKQMLTAIAGQVAFIIEHSKMVGRIVEEERLQRELALATEVQQRLFPDAPPASESLDLSGFCQPARGVGGDYYDFLKLDQGQIGIAVADVAGKGIAAALLMSIIQASLRSQTTQRQAIENKSSLADLVCEMNNLLWRSTSAASYVTFFYAQFDEAKRQLNYVNAGHNPPLLFRASHASKDAAPQHATVGGLHQQQRARAAGASTLNETKVSRAVNGFSEALTRTELMNSDNSDDAASRWTKLTAGGMALGLFDESRYEQETIQLSSGDLLVAYTDGVTEALNVEDEEFGEARLQEVVAASAHLAADEVREQIVQRVGAWSQGAPQHDDLTFIVLKVR
jgi:sigma-B regulation protein RsbU (phosphoserine phosphatase)